MTRRCSIPRRSSADRKQAIHRYLAHAYRRDLRAFGPRWPLAALALWSRLNPESTASTALGPVADLGKYMASLRKQERRGQFRAPPARAQDRRDRARKARRAATDTKRRSPGVANPVLEGAPRSGCMVTPEEFSRAQGHARSNARAVAAGPGVIT